MPGWLAALRLMDGDGDGRVSAAEHAAAAKRMFTGMDRDGDGRVTVEEMAAARGKLSDQLTDTEQALRKVDGNGDGVLDGDEHSKSTRVQFDLVDRDHNGYMSAQELQATDRAAR